MDFKKQSKKKRLRVLKRWKRLTKALLQQQKIKADMLTASAMKDRVTKNNICEERCQPKVEMHVEVEDFTKFEEPEQQFSPTNGLLIVDDLGNEEEGIIQNVDILKSSFQVRRNLLNVQHRFEVIQKFKERMLAVFQARPLRKKFQEIKKATLVLQNHFRRIIAMRIQSKKTQENEERYKQLK